MERLVIAGGRVLTDGRTGPATVVIEGGRIAGILPPGEERSLSGYRLIRADGCYVAPGYVDLLVHGGGGIDCLDGDLEALGRRLAAHGTTGFLAGLRSAPIELVRTALQQVGEVMHAPGNPDGARLLGAHIEGLYFNPEWCGAQARDTLRTPDVQEALELASIGRGALRVKSLSPELAGTLPVIAALSARGVRVSIGHSCASPAQVDAAIAAGACLVTHLYNATGGPFYREPGVRTQDFSIGALTRDALVVTVIAVGIHVEPELFDLTRRAKGTAGIALVTDAMTAAGLPDGTYPSADGRPVIISGGAARLEDGGLFGSVLTLDVAVQNVVRWGVPLPDAVTMAATVPARVLGLGHCKGRVLQGYDADLVVLDSDLAVNYTIVGGVPVYGEE